MNSAKTPNDGVTNVDQTFLPTTVRLERLRVMVLLWIAIAMLGFCSRSSPLLPRLETAEEGVEVTDEDCFRDSS